MIGPLFVFFLGIFLGATVVPLSVALLAGAVSSWAERRSFGKRARLAGVISLAGRRGKKRRAGCRS